MCEDRHDDHPLQAGGFLNAVANNVGDVHLLQLTIGPASSFTWQLGDHADLLDAGIPEPIEDVHQFLKLESAIAAKEDLLVARGLHLLADSLLEGVHANHLGAE